MTIELKEVSLDVGFGDNRGLLVFRSGTLLAVAAQLSDLHDDRAGWWFLEVIFNLTVRTPREPFPTIQALHTWLDEQI